MDIFSDDSGREPDIVYKSINTSMSFFYNSFTVWLQIKKMEKNKAIAYNLQQQKNLCWTKLCLYNSCKLFTQHITCLNHAEIKVILFL